MLWQTKELYIIFFIFFSCNMDTHQKHILQQMNDKSGISANNSCFYYVTLELKINSSKLYHHYKTENAVKSANCDCKHSLITLVTHLDLFGTCPISFAVLHISSSSSLVNNMKCTNSLANLQKYNNSTAKSLS